MKGGSPNQIDFFGIFVKMSNVMQVASHFKQIKTTDNEDEKIERNFRRDKYEE